VDSVPRVPEELMRLWRARLADAKLQYDFACNFVKEVRRDFSIGDGCPDGQYAYQKAVRGESAALAWYKHVLQLYADLVLRGTVPDEGEWRKRQADDAAGKENGDGKNL